MFAIGFLFSQGPIYDDLRKAECRPGPGADAMPHRDDVPRDMLFGLLALQNGMVTRDQLVLAFGAWTGAAGSLREGLDELFTINRLGLPSELRRCLGTTNLIDNGHAALRDRVRRVKNWQNGAMALRWTAVAFDAIAKGFRRIMGYKHLWMLKAARDEPSRDRSLVDQAGAG